MVESIKNCNKQAQGGECMTRKITVTFKDVHFCLIHKKGGSVIPKLTKYV